MKEYLEKMNEDVILTGETIENFRQDIQSKYPALSKKGRASLLAKEMNYILDEQMNGVPVEYRADIRMEIYTSFISAISNHLTKLDVFKGVEAVYRADDEYLDLLFEWMHSNTLYDVDYRTFKSFMVINYEHFIETGELMDLEPILPQVSVGKEAFEPMDNGLPKRLFLFLPIFIIVILLLNTWFNKDKVLESTSQYSSMPMIIEPFATLDVESYVAPIYRDLYVAFPTQFKYRVMDMDKLKAYLEIKNSALLEDDYLMVIDEVANDFNINPYLLLAIIGQEQNFIASDQMYKEEILKNPFNVFNSWEQYGISFRDSAEIAARTVRNSLDQRPLGADPIPWINTTYAEDPFWQEGVEYFFYFFDQNM